MPMVFMEVVIMCEDRKKVEALISRLSEVEGVSWSEARRSLHKYVCEGRCEWYRTKSREAGFDRLDLKDEERRLIGEIIREVMGEADMEELKWRIHRILCPGHPRPRPK